MAADGRREPVLGGFRDVAPDQRRAVRQPRRGTQGNRRQAASRETDAANPKVGGFLRRVGCGRRRPHPALCGILRFAADILRWAVGQHLPDEGVELGERCYPFIGHCHEVYRFRHEESANWKVQTLESGFQVSVPAVGQTDLREQTA